MLGAVHTLKAFGDSHALTPAMPAVPLVAQSMRDDPPILFAAKDSGVASGRVKIDV
jgi:hypothetical protein